MGGSYNTVKNYLRDHHFEGYEVHHIPSKAVVREWGSMYVLPAIALLKEDHAKTDSFRYKSRKKYTSFLPDVNESSSYMDLAHERLSEGEFFELIQIELLNIRDQCGKRYDGAIARYLDVLEQYISQNGYPEK